MSQASMQFAPQWLKKPSLSSAAAFGAPSSTQSTDRIASPPLGQPRTSTPPNGSINGYSGLSYSHMVNPTSGRSEAFPGDAGGMNGAGSRVTDQGRPFRYSKETMLALFDENQVKNRPLELLELGELGGVVLNDRPGLPMGLVDWTEDEKKLFSASLNPTNTARRQPNHHPTSGLERDISSTTAPSFLRRGTGGSSTAAASAASGRTSISGGFGRGEGGAFGGGKVGDLGGEKIEKGDGRGERERERERFVGSAAFNGGGALGSAALGGGPGPDVRRNARPLRGTAENEPSPKASGAAQSWRPSIRPPSMSGSFEGVLGFNNSEKKSADPEPVVPTGSVHGPLIGGGGVGWREREKAAHGGDRFGAPNADSGINGLGHVGASGAGMGGGPGWGKGGGRWRMAAAQGQDGEAEKVRPSLATLSLADNEPKPSASTNVIPPLTPVEERDAKLSPPRSPDEQNGRSETTASKPTSPPGLQELESVLPENFGKWFYKDPAGQHQGPFTSEQMQDWYKMNYFIESLPIRRGQDTAFRTLLSLKRETGDDISPFLPRQINPPPNLPLPPTFSQNPSDSPQVGAQSPYGAPSNPVFGGSMSGPGAYAGSPAMDQAQLYNGASDNAPGGQPMRSVWTDGSSGGMARQSAGNYASEPPRSIFTSSDPMGHMPRMQSPMAYPGPTAMGGPISPWGMPPAPMAYMQAPQPPYQQYQQYPQPGPNMDGYQQPQNFQNWPPAPAPIGHSPYQQAPNQLMGSPLPAPSQPQQGLAPEQTATVPAPSPAPSASAPAPPIAAAVPSIPSTPVAVPAPIPAAVETPAEEAAPAPASSTKTPVALPRLTPSPAPISIQAKEKAAATQPQTPASLPAKPVTVVLPTTSRTPGSSPTKAVKAAPSESTDGPASPTQEKKTKAKMVPLDLSAPAVTASPKAAPWAAKEDEKAGPSMKEIQEAEAKIADAKRIEDAKRRAALAAAQANAAAATPEPEAAQPMSWGVSSRGTSASPAPSGPAAPVWGAGDAGAKKTLKQIQEEEERRKKAQAQAKAAASARPGAATSTKRGYADLAAAPVASNPAASAWSTVGTGGRTVAPTVAPRPVPVATKPIITTLPTPAPKPVVMSLDDVAPSLEFIRWTKETLKGLAGVNLDEFIQMLMTFPVEPGKAGLADQLEIISDSVYANSSTLDGKRFAQDFYTKRKADAQNRLSGGRPLPAKANSLADIVKTQPKQTNEFGGFKVVKPKGKTAKK